MSNNKFLDIKPNPKKRPIVNVGPPPHPRAQSLASSKPQQHVAKPRVKQAPPLPIPPESRPEPEQVLAAPGITEQSITQTPPRAKFIRDMLRPKMLFYLAAAAIIGSLAVNQAIGEVIIIVYGIYALVRKVPSRTSFILALVAFAYTPVALLIGGVVIAHAFASYAFLLLFFAMFSLVREQIKKP